MIKNKKYYHISHISGLTKLVPFKNKIFITIREHIPFWSSWVRSKHDLSVDDIYVYEVGVSQEAEIGVGIEGEENGDFFVVTDRPLPVKQVEWDLRRNRPKRKHKSKY